MGSVADKICFPPDLCSPPLHPPLPSTNTHHIPDRRTPRRTWNRQSILISAMDQSTYRSLRQQQPQQAQQQQQQAQNGYEPLPPPSQLGSSSNFRTNTLPPLNVSQSSISQPSLSLSSSTVPASPSTRGYPPPTYNHPSLSNAAAQPLAMAGMASWGHRPSNSRTALQRLP